MKKILPAIILALLIIPVLSDRYVLAAKPRVKTTTKSSTGTAGFSSVRLRSDRKATVISLFNLSNIQNVSYSLVYTANGVEQGVAGTINASGQNSISRELLFGTCSKAVCTYHRNISNMRLRLTATTKSGVTLVKAYRIKV